MDFLEKIIGYILLLNNSYKEKIFYFLSILQI